MIDNILYLDLETDKKGNIGDVGALFRGQELHEKQLTKLEFWITETDYICGHNIIAHDIPMLAEKLGKHVFDGKKIIDTLLWSPLLFSDNPYHKLVKGYKIVNDSDVNNPLSDCKLTKELLYDELNKFKELPHSLQRIFNSLLSHNQAYSGFLSIVNGQDSNNNIQAANYDYFYGKICQTSAIDYISKQHPVELAYALALINTKKDDSILSPWVLKTLPDAQEILDNLRFKSCESSDCDYCNTMLSPKKALLNYFGYDDFRSFEEGKISLQEKAVRAGLSKESFVAVFPTGGGKSLTFQLPALMQGSLTRQLTVVISPLVSLMKDQVDNLEDRFGITKAVAINGLLSPLEREEAIERVEDGEIHLLYLSPESLRSPTILRILRQRSIARFVIDEAHCFSSWGQDFRVDYLYIGEFIKVLKKERFNELIPISCYTATAKPQVVKDIKHYFEDGLNITLNEYITRAGRTNLRYEVIHVEEPKDKMAKLLPLLSDCEKPVIIYASRIKRVEEINSLIEEAGFNATFFHGKLDKDVKKEHMDSFMQGQKDIIVATSAFGMGVDKDDVKSVIHYNISDSLENYIQEAGRAGRDEKIQAKCYILYNENDLSKHFSLLQQTKINQKEIQQIWQALKQLIKFRNSKKISHSALEIAQKAGWDTDIHELETRVTTSIAALEDQGFLKRKQNSPRIFANSLMVPNLATALEILNQSNELTATQFEHCSRVMQRIVKDDEARLDYIADRTGLTLYQVNDVIEILRSHKILGDAKDLTAFIDLANSPNGTKIILEKHIKIENALRKCLPRNIKISMRQLNQNIIDSGVSNCSIDAIKNILNYWDIRKFINKTRVDRQNDIYEIKFRPNNELDEDIKWRHDLSAKIYSILHNLKEKENIDGKKNVPVSFSMLQLKESNQFLGRILEEDVKRYERVLLFMNKIKAIKLEGGFMVSYNKLNIEDIDDSIKRFTVGNYEKMGTHYDHKTEQIHIVGEYAKKRIQNYEGAISYVNDYFSQPYEEFLAKYFPRRKTEILRPLTPERFKEINGELDLEQSKVVFDNKSDNILVLAGPGSGKTRVLVHKIASLLLLEDIKPEQFLMLTFSKAAALEFRYRARKLVPEFAGLVKITTFHGFCFQLMGQLGDLRKSENIIQDCIKAIEKEEIDISSIVNKSVLLLDEFQDINKDEWKLIETIISTSQSIKTIAVGDDDQNIYGFRGSSSSFMNAFREKYTVTAYELVKNYRSKSSIVRFNNELLVHIPNRIKTNELVANDNKLVSTIRLVKYQSHHLEKALVDYVTSLNEGGTRAILVRTNEQGLLINTFLRDAGVKTKMITGLDGFRLDQLLEMRTLTNLLKESVDDSGFIYNDDWDEAKAEFSYKYNARRYFSTCKEAILKFEEHYPKRKQIVEWYEYVREIKMEDAVNVDADAIVIATMHKAKGKEFDRVYLLLDNYDFSSSEARRLVYVGCTRAKQSLHIHTNNPFFDSFEYSGFIKTKYNGITSEPEHFEYILGLKDVNLKTSKYSRTAKIIDTLTSGDQLINDIVRFPTNDASGLAKPGSRNILIYSRSFVDGPLETFKKKGYNIQDAEVEYIVYWYDSDEDKEHKIVLPKLSFVKSESKSGIDKKYHN